MSNAKKLLGVRGEKPELGFDHLKTECACQERYFRANLDEIIRGPYLPPAMARNYFKFQVAAGTIGGAPTTQVFEFNEKGFAAMQNFISQLDAGSSPFEPTTVWFPISNFLFRLWLNRFLGNLIWEPPTAISPTSGSDQPPIVFPESPKGIGKVDYSEGHIKF